MTELGELKWIFNRTSGISDSKMLKEKVLGALRNADGSPIDALKKIPFEKVKKLFPKDELIDEVNFSDRLLKNLSTDTNFKKIFVIVKS